MEEPRFISIDDFFAQANKDSVIIDARSPKEFNQGHIPQAINIPLLNNEHRHLVGCCYKEQGQDAAIQLGYQLVTPLFVEIQQQALSVAPQKKVYLHCWRGGLRSKITAGLLMQVGIDVEIIQGGYKAWRNELLKEWEVERKGLIISGHTGTGKTDLLQALAALHENVIDLEELALHKGSAFGGLAMPDQPTQEQFENLLAIQLRKLHGSQKPIFIESESRMIGRIRIPDSFYSIMWSWPRIAITRNLNERISYIASTYEKCSNEELSEKTNQLKKRMGYEQVKDAVEYLQNGNREDWIKKLLIYYDKGYEHHSQLIKTPLLFYIEHPLHGTNETALKLISQCQNIFN